MSCQIVKQPNGLYALWSSAVDDFIAVDCSPEEIIEDEVNSAREDARVRATSIINKLEQGEKPYYQSTMTYDQCLAQRRLARSAPDST